MEGGYSLNRGEAHAGVSTHEAIVGSAALDGEGVGLRLELLDGSLYLLEFDISVMIELDVSRQAPVLKGVCCLDKEVEGGLVGCHALDEPEGKDVGGSVGDDGGESVTHGLCVSGLHGVSRQGY